MNSGDGIQCRLKTNGRIFWRTTIESKRTMGVMDILDDLVPATSPMISVIGVDSQEAEEKPIAVCWWK